VYQVWAGPEPPSLIGSDDSFDLGSLGWSDDDVSVVAAECCWAQLHNWDNAEERYLLGAND
jgi:hypothetical protein